MTGTLTALLLATLAFVGGHFILSAPPIRASMVGVLGERAFAGVYSVLMIVALIWLIAAYRVAPPRIVWDFGPWINIVPIVAMPFASILAVLGLIARSPTGVMGDQVLAKHTGSVRGP